MSTKRKSKKIPGSVILRLNKSLAEFESALLSDPTFSIVRTATRVRVRKNQTPVFAMPAFSGKKVAFLDSGSEHKVGAAAQGFVGIERNDVASWIKRDDIAAIITESGPISPVPGQAGLTDVPQGVGIGSGSGWFGRKKDELVRRAINLRNDFVDNPCVTLKGFSIEFGISPSFSLEFEFKT